jgi:hypothetical protein
MSRESKPSEYARTVHIRGLAVAPLLNTVSPLDRRGPQSIGEDFGVVG